MLKLLSTIALAAGALSLPSAVARKPRPAPWERPSAATPSTRPPRKARPPRISIRTRQLTFSIVTHTAGNGFFDPTYVGAKVAADAFGINLVMLGSEAPVDDIPREIPDPQSDHQRPDDRRRDHDHAAVRRL